jgi:hypothetical protein
LIEFFLKVQRLLIKTTFLKWRLKSPTKHQKASRTRDLHSLTKRKNGDQERQPMMLKKLRPLSMGIDREGL